MRQHATSATVGPIDPESPISARIDAAERELQGLCRERAGQMEPGQDWGWCSQCARNAVSSLVGEDTCPACVAGMVAGRAGSPA